MAAGINPKRPIPKITSIRTSTQTTLVFRYLISIYVQNENSKLFRQQKVINSKGLTKVTTQILH